jgi:predicted amidohydrolase YtcJ
VTTGVGFEYVDMGVPVAFEEGGKQAALDFMAAYVRDNPGLDCYRFNLERASLDVAEIVKEELDAICPDAELVILEDECHSNWVNSRVLDRMGVTDETPDPVPGLAYFVRRDGHVTGNSYETASWPILFDSLRGITDEQIDVALERWVAYSVRAGVSCVFDAGFPEHNELHERMYARLREMDRKGRLPVYIDGCYVVTQPRQVEKAIEELRRMKREFDTEHLKVHTFKIFMDGTLKIETAAMVTPYVDTGAVGATALSVEQLAEVLVALNEEGLDFHAHCVGEASSRVVLDGVELAKARLGDDFHVRVTCAHLWIQDDADLSRFAELGVAANFSPWWHAGNIGGNPRETWAALIGGDRADKMWRCKTLWDTGALVTWSSDEVFYGDFTNWSPYLGMEVGMTRWIRERTVAEPLSRTCVAYPADAERMSIGEMLTGYTINGAVQLGIDDAKGSITEGKDADFLVFDQDLTTAEHEGFSRNMPSAVYFGGTRMA